MQVQEVMTRDPNVVTPETAIAEVARMMAKLDVGLIPVVDGSDTRRVQGVITDRDITVRHVAQDHGPACPVSDHMTRDVRTVNEHDSGADVMRAMRSEKIRRVPVLGEGGRLVGIVAQADLAVASGPRDRDAVEETLEEISQPAAPERPKR
jgi:CBS-domain-containing membrane protein